LLTRNARASQAARRGVGRLDDSKTGIVGPATSGSIALASD
jgi:hypothetical protein